ncbi:MAG: TonB family protein [Planctomycetota bacterium]
MTRTAVLVSVMFHLVVLGGLWVVAATQPVAPAAPEPRVVESARMQIRWVPRTSLPEVKKPPIDVAEESVQVEPRMPAVTEAQFHPRSVHDLSGGEAPQAAPRGGSPALETPSAPPEAAVVVDKPSSTRVTLPPTESRVPAPNPTAVPTLVSQVVVEYPELCRRLGHEGVVELRLDIAPSGRVSAAVVTQSSGCDRLDASAQKAALTLEYLPAHIDGAPRSGQADLEIRFTLESPRR